MPPANNSGYYRHPTIYNDYVVFVSEDDLWSVPAAGGVARRLTSGLGQATWPRLSLDGTQLAFVGREAGPAEIYVMPALGGAARRLTYMGGTQCFTAGWSPEGKIIFASNTHQPFTSLYQLYTVDLQDGALLPLAAGPAREISFGPAASDGTRGMVIGRNTVDTARWKRYRGGTAGQLWIDSQGDGQFRPLVDLQSNLAAPMWIGERIYFLSDHEGVGNLYSCRPDGEDLRRHTDHEDYYVRNPSTDGQRIVYHSGGDLYGFDPQADLTWPIPVAYYSSFTQRSQKYVDAERYLDDWELHPGGQALAVTTRGQLFTFANWEGPVVQQDPAARLEEAASSEPTAAEAGAEAGAESPAVSLDGVGDMLTPYARYRLPRWLSDGRRLIAVTDAGGEEFFVIWHANGRHAPEPLKGLDIGRPDAVVVSPQKDEIVFSNHRYELWWLDLKTRELRLIDRAHSAPVSGAAWSPDGDWVAYSVSTSLHVRQLKLWKAATGEITPLTEPVLRDVAPTFDPSGNFIYFISYRNFDPVYDNLHFDLNFPRGMRPYLIALQKDQPSPFTPRPRLRALTEDPPEDEKETADKPADDLAAEPADAPAQDGGGSAAAENAAPAETATAPAEVELAVSSPADEPDAAPPVEAAPAEGQAAGGAEKEAKQEEEPPKVQIDLEGISQRIIAFPVPEGIYGRILGVQEGRVLYTRFPVEGSLHSSWTAPGEARGILLSYGFEDQKEDTLVHGINDFDVTPGGAYLIYRAGNSLRVLKATEKPGEGHGNTRKSGWIDLERLKVAVDPAAEWRQMFREAWRLQRDQFWTPDMSQVDWLEVYQRYQPLVERVGTRAELSDLLWEMQGELGTSHAYELGGDYRPGPDYAPGRLGADFVYEPETDSWRITHIVSGDVWDPQYDSPLHTPGANVQVGDRLIAINGRRLGRRLSPSTALVNLAGEEVSLAFRTEDKLEENGEAKAPEKPKAGQWRTVAVKTLAHETNARYREWVERNRQRVHTASDGRVGYVHIPDMGPRGYAEFHRGYLSEVDRDGLLVDVRFNGGGHVSGLILEKLARRRLGYSKARWGQAPYPYPEESAAGTMVALTNEYAGSDGDIFSHGFKMLKLGPLLGKRTWGGVIGIEPRHRLVDGSITTQPEFSFWFTDVGWGVENYGTDPDIEVDNRPQDYASGIDRQLEAAIAEVLRLLQEQPPAPPNLTNWPPRRRPKLPER